MVAAEDIEGLSQTDERLLIVTEVVWQAVCNSSIARRETRMVSVAIVGIGEAEQSNGPLLLRTIASHGTSESFRENLHASMIPDSLAGSDREAESVATDDAGRKSALLRPAL